MKKIWDKQNNQPLYVLDEPALHNRIGSKKRKTGHITNISELLSIVVNLALGGMILGVTLYGNGNVYMYILASWMLIVAAVVTVTRVQRIGSQSTFDRSILGDLDHTIATASYQVRLSGMLRWNVVPVAVLITLGVWNSGKGFALAVGILAFSAITWYASGWEHNYYRRRKSEVEALRKMVLSE
ncbi:MAG TPA: hypothetical protein VK508_06950 [Cyclobacteriaceae bacterium]|nr:hypothetical protein [Cyclobacteriaceae bacterium]